MTYEDLKKENAMLRRKLSPLEDPKFTDDLALRLGPLDLAQYKRKFRKSEYVVLSLSEVARICALPHDKPTLTNIARSLQAMCWERSAIGGNLVFVMPLKEYMEGMQ